MSQITQLFHRGVFASVMLFVASTLASATPVTNRKDDIEIAVTSKMDDSGKTLITCVLSNHSPHTIAATNLQTHSSAFYFKLLDQSGTEIMQNPEWAKSFAQKSAERYRHPRSFRIDQANPGGKIEFQFYLENAYGSESPKGQEMVVSWESGYFDDVIVTSDYANAEGKQVKGSDEKYMFPERWDISVTLPLKEKANEEPKKPAGPDSEIHSNARVPAKSDPRGTPPSAQASGEKKDQSNSNYWWLLLLLPAIVIAVFVDRLRKS